MDRRTGTVGQEQRTRDVGTDGQGQMDMVHEGWGQRQGQMDMEHEGWGQRQGQMDMVHEGWGFCVEWGSTNRTGTLMFMMMKTSTHIEV